MVGTFSPLFLSVPKANAQIPVILEASNPVLFLELEGVEKASGTFIVTDFFNEFVRLQRNLDILE